MSDSVTYSLPLRTQLTMHLEANNSTTISFQFSNGSTYTWNSGQYMSCTILAAGASLMVVAITETPALRTLTAVLVAKGCTYVEKQINDHGGSGGGGMPPTDGGDIQLPPYDPDSAKKPGGHWQYPELTGGHQNEHFSMHGGDQVSSSGHSTVGGLDVGIVGVPVPPPAV